MSKDASHSTAVQELQQLAENYRITVEMTSGTGRRGDSYVQAAHAKIVAFAKAHPEMKIALQPPARCSNDGAYGTRDGMSSIAGIW